MHLNLDSFTIFFTMQKCLRWAKPNDADGGTFFFFFRTDESDNFTYNIL